MAATNAQQLNENFDESFQLPSVMLASIGFELSISGIEHTQNRKKVLLYEFLKFVNYFNVAGGMTLQLIFAVQAIGNSANFLDLTALAPCVGVCIICLAKTLTVHQKSRGTKLYDLVQELKTMWPNNLENETEQNTVNVYMKQARLITKGFSILYILLIWIFILTPIAEMLLNYYIDGHTEKVLPFSLWMPFDSFSTYGYPIAYLFDFLASFALAFGSVGVDILFVTINSHICMQLSLVQFNLRNLIERADNELKRVDSDQNKQHIMNTLLEKCIERHAQLINFSSDLEDIFSPSILVNFLGSSIVICLVGFQSTVITGIHTFKYATFLISSLVQIFILCQSGNQLITISSGVSDAAYNSSWYVADARFRRSLQILMTRAQRPLQLTAMKFSVVSIPSFSTILSTSYSYFTLLRTVYEDPA